MSHFTPECNPLQLEAKCFISGGTRTLLMFYIHLIQWPSICTTKGVTAMGSLTNICTDS